MCEPEISYVCEWLLVAVQTACAPLSCTWLSDRLLMRIEYGSAMSVIRCTDALFPLRCGPLFTASLLDCFTSPGILSIDVFLEWVAIPVHTEVSLNRYSASVKTKAATSSVLFN